MPSTPGAPLAKARWNRRTTITDKLPAHAKCDAAEKPAKARTDSAHAGTSPYSTAQCVHGHPIDGAQVRSHVGRSAGDSPSRSGRLDKHADAIPDGMPTTLRACRADLVRFPGYVRLGRASAPSAAVQVAPIRRNSASSVAALKPCRSVVVRPPTVACACARGRNGMRGAAVAS